MLGRLFFAVTRAGRSELDRLRWTLFTIFVATAIGCIPILLFRFSIEATLWWTLIPWLFSAYRLFDINRLIGMHIMGEGIEFSTSFVSSLRSLPEGVVAQTPEQTGPFDNEFIRDYLATISGIFFVQTSLFLALPLYVKYTIGGATTAILIMMLMTMTLIASPRFFEGAYRFCAVSMIVVYCAGLTFYLIPQTGFYAKSIGFDRIKIVPQSTAQIANEIESLRARQIEELNNQRLREGLSWQRSNPGQQLPQMYKQQIQEIGKVVATSDTKPVPEKRIASNSTSSSSSNEELEMRVRRIYGK